MASDAQDEVRRLLGLIEEVDPLLRSVCDVNPHALAEAETRDRESSEGRRRSPLHGRPVLVKDNIDTAGLATTAGSLALAGSPPLTDAPLVRRLRDAGMVVLGKTNLSEWANIRSPDSVSGWSAYGGLTRNPYALNRSASGSSSGSGAAVAARLAPYAVGTETNGSISSPASVNGVVGLKPTVGLVPTDGVVPISWSQDAPGPMALNVTDAAALLDVMAGTDTSASVDDGARGLRVGVPRNVWGFNRHADETAEQALGQLSRAGVELVDDVALPGVDDLDFDHALVLMLVELRTGLERYLATREVDVRTLADVVDFNRAHSDAELGVFGQELFERALELGGPASREYLDAVDACTATGLADLDRVLGEHDLDALLAPAAAPAGPIDLVNGDAWSGGSSTSSALAGAPILSVPVALVRGLPVGVNLWGARQSEPTLLRLGRALEAERDHDTGPLPAPTLPEVL